MLGSANGVTPCNNRDDDEEVCLKLQAHSIRNQHVIGGRGRARQAFRVGRGQLLPGLVIRERPVVDSANRQQAVGRAAGSVSRDTNSWGSHEKS
jgi:hypothetical protein